MAAPTAEGDAGKGDEIIALLEGFSNKLNVVEKENRRRRNPDERVVHEGRPATSVKEELSSLKDELHNMRRANSRARPRPRSTAATVFKLAAALVICVVAYLYWYKLSQPLGVLHWGSSDINDDGDEMDGISFLDRVHFGFRKTGGSQDARKSTGGSQDARKSLRSGGDDKAKKDGSIANGGGDGAADRGKAASEDSSQVGEVSKVEKDESEDKQETAGKGVGSVTRKLLWLTATDKSSSDRSTWRGSLGSCCG